MFPAQKALSFLFCKIFSPEPLFPSIFPLLEMEEEELIHRVAGVSYLVCLGAARSSVERLKEPWDEEILSVIPSAQCDESWGERGKGWGLEREPSRDHQRHQGEST